MRRTIRQCIKDSVSIRNKNNIAISFFIGSMATLMTTVAYKMNTIDYEDVKIENEIFCGKAKRNPTGEDILSVMNGSDPLRSTDLSMKVVEFIGWLLNEYEPEEKLEKLWNELGWLSFKWNEFVALDVEQQREMVS